MYTGIIKTYGIIKVYHFMDSEGEPTPYAVEVFLFNGNVIECKKTFTILETVGEYSKLNPIGRLPLFLEGSELVTRGELREKIFQAGIGIGCYNFIFQDNFSYKLISSFCYPENPARFIHFFYKVFSLENVKKKLEKDGGTEEELQFVKRLEGLI